MGVLSLTGYWDRDGHKNAPHTLSSSSVTLSRASKVLTQGRFPQSKKPHKSIHINTKRPQASPVAVPRILQNTSHHKDRTSRNEWVGRAAGQLSRPSWSSECSTPVHENLRVVSVFPRLVCYPHSSCCHRWISCCHNWLLSSVLHLSKFLYARRRYQHSAIFDISINKFGAHSTPLGRESPWFWSGILYELLVGLCFCLSAMKLLGNLRPTLAMPHKPTRCLCWVISDSQSWIRRVNNPKETSPEAEWLALTFRSRHPWTGINRVPHAVSSYNLAPRLETKHLFRNFWYLPALIGL